MPAESFGHVDCRYNEFAVVAMLDGHVELLDFKQMNDMRLWSNLSAQANESGWITGGGGNHSTSSSGSSGSTSAREVIDGKPKNENLNLMNMKALSLLATLVVSGSAPLLCAQLPPPPRPATSFGAAIAGEWLYVYGGNDAKAHEFHRDRISGDFSRVKLTNGEVWEKLAVDTPLLGAPLATHHGWI